MNIDLMEIRKAKLDEIVEIQKVIRSAFYREDKDQEFNEWTFVKNILSDPGYVNELSLVATAKNEIVGYVILTMASINEHLGLSLGPIAVKPEYQSLGIGRKLIASSINKAKKLKYNWIALTGSDYYLSSGFEPAEPSGIVLSENNPENMFLKILYLNEEKRGSVKGVMKFCDSFYNEKGELL